jgi:hypothetical protein
MYTCVAYNPCHPVYQRISHFFWSRYSQEVDSWRDQPLWGYSVYNFNVTPVDIGPIQGRLYNPMWKRMGHGGHRYTNG